MGRYDLDMPACLDHRGHCEMEGTTYHGRVPSQLQEDTWEDLTVYFSNSRAKAPTINV